MLVKIYSDSPSQKSIIQVADILAKGGVVIFPTDTIYAMGCSIRHIRTIDRITGLKGKKKGRKSFSIIVNSISMATEYIKPIDNHIFRLMKKNLPGPFTFILEAGNNISNLFHSKRKTIGVRIPDHPIISLIVEELGHPIVTTSIRDEDTILEYTTDPELIYEKYQGKVDMVIDAGYGDNEASTIVDCTSGEPEILRQGKGFLQE